MIDTATFDRDPKTVKQARRFVIDRLGACDPAIVDNVALMTSELVTNAIHYSAGDHVSVALEIDVDCIRVTVYDTSASTPTVRNPASDEPSGRGLRIVSTLADDWGTAPNVTAGNAVWFAVRHAVAIPDVRATQRGHLAADPALEAATDHGRDRLRDSRTSTESNPRSATTTPMSSCTRRTPVRRSTHDLATAGLRASVHDGAASSERR